MDRWRDGILLHRWAKLETCAQHQTNIYKIDYWVGEVDHTSGSHWYGGWWWQCYKSHRICNAFLWSPFSCFENTHVAFAWSCIIQLSLEPFSYLASFLRFASFIGFHTSWGSTIVFRTITQDWPVYFYIHLSGLKCFQHHIEIVMRFESLCFHCIFLSHAYYDLLPLASLIQFASDKKTDTNIHVITFVTLSCILPHVIIYTYATFLFNTRDLVTGQSSTTNTMFWQTIGGLAISFSLSHCCSILSVFLCLPFLVVCFLWLFQRPFFAPVLSNMTRIVWACKIRAIACSLVGRVLLLHLANIKTCMDDTLCSELIPPSTGFPPTWHYVQHCQSRRFPGFDNSN